jgi:hypothetical protein
MGSIFTLLPLPKDSLHSRYATDNNCNNFSRIALWYVLEIFNVQEDLLGAKEVEKFLYLHTIMMVIASKTTGNRIKNT